MLNDCIHRFRDAMSALIAGKLFSDINMSMIAAFFTAVYFIVSTVGVIQRMRRESRDFKSRGKDDDKSQKGSSL